jgi:hypothetical protein
MSCNDIVISDPIDPTIEKDLLGCDPGTAHCPFQNSILYYKETKWQGNTSSYFLKSTSEGSCIPRSDGGGTDTVTFLLSESPLDNGVQVTCQRVTSPTPLRAWDCVLGSGKTAFSFTGGEPTTPS